MTSNTAEVIAFFVVAVSFIVAAAVFVVSVCYLIKWIRAYFNKESKPFRIRIAIAFVVVSLIALLFVCTELIPKISWPFHF
jgi:H+/Cl- antiporter ClcA